MMQQLQTALGKIGDLEIEVRSLRTEQEKGGTNGGQQFVHDDITGRSTATVSSSPVRQLAKCKDVTKEDHHPRLFNTLFTAEHWSKIKTSSSRQENHRQEIWESITYIGEITINCSATSSDNDILRGGDDESGGRSLLDSWCQ